MAELDLKKLNRAQLLEMMLKFSEEAENAIAHENEMQEQFNKEKEIILQQAADEREELMHKFDTERNEMRQKFAEQRAVQQAKFDKDIEGLKARLEREKTTMKDEVDIALHKISNSGSIADAAIRLSDVMEAAQESADMYVELIKRQINSEYQDLQNDMKAAKSRIELQEKKSLEKCKAMEEETKRKCAELLKKAEYVYNHPELIASVKTGSTKETASKTNTNSKTATKANTTTKAKITTKPRTTRTKKTEDM